MTLLTDKDLQDWQNLTQETTPLDKETIKVPDMPKTLRAKPVGKRQLLTTLDLHGFTVQEAFEETKRFILVHQKAGTKLIHIITGRGIGGVGKIKKEMPLWLQTPFFQERVNSFSWENSGGVVAITLKKVK